MTSHMWVICRDCKCCISCGLSYYEEENAFVSNVNGKPVELDFDKVSKFKNACPEKDIWSKYAVSLEVPSYITLSNPYS